MSSVFDHQTHGTSAWLYYVPLFYVYIPFLTLVITFIGGMGDLFVDTAPLYSTGDGKGRRGDLEHLIPSLTANLRQTHPFFL